MCVLYFVLFCCSQFEGDSIMNLWAVGHLTSTVRKLRKVNHAAAQPPSSTYAVQYPSQNNESTTVNRFSHLKYNQDNAPWQAQVAPSQGILTSLQVTVNTGHPGDHVGNQSHPDQYITFIYLFTYLLHMYVWAWGCHGTSASQKTTLGNWFSTMWVPEIGLRLSGL